MNTIDELKKTVLDLQTEMFGPIFDLLDETEVSATKYYDKGVFSANSKVKMNLMKMAKLVNYREAKPKMKDLQSHIKDIRKQLIDEVRSINFAKKNAKEAKRKAADVNSETTVA